ncbi:TerD family protein [Paenibacillus kobensis]|uniref:TerD family protein n=1 Tax=Paenibacillus kobensis TaxID=59841 RepID=UPI000FDB3F5E|nr:TerD family protein [Paenibacillus kobensis]
MSVSAVKGQKLDLTKTNPGLTKLSVGIGWTSSQEVELDTSAFLLGANGMTARDEDLIFYNNRSNGFIRYEDGSNTDRKTFDIDLQKAPAQVDKIAFSLTLYNERQSFKQVNDAYIRFLNGTTGQEVIRYDLGNNFSVENAVVIGELYRYNGEWKFNAIGSGFSGGLNALCGNFGIVVKDEPAGSSGSDKPTPAPTPAPVPPPAAPTPPRTSSSAISLAQQSSRGSSDASASPPSSTFTSSSSSSSSSEPHKLNLTKIELKKKGDRINLTKSSGGSLGEILVNLNWNQRTGKSGLFGRGGRSIDLDLACLFELKDGRKGVVQALGNSFGSLTRAPYIMLDGDDRTGTVKTGENIRINGAKVSEIERILVFTFIYEGVANWSEADGVVTISQSGGPDIIVHMNEYDNRKGMCAIAMIQNVNNETFSIERLVQFYNKHSELDQDYGWGMRWVAGSKQ